MGVQRNKDGIEKAKKLIRDGKYVLDSSWGDSQPSTDEQNKYIEKNGTEAFAEWHLAEHTSEDKDKKARYGFPFGDFKKVHRSGLIAAKQRAAQNDYNSVEKAADELLEMLDETSSKKAA
jgi:hypothetical protein